MRTSIAVCNQKGGVGKTTTAVSLGLALSRLQQHVHLIDMDPQADLTTALGMHDPEGLLYKSLSENSELPVVTVTEYLTLSASSIDMSRGESSFLAEHGREFLLQDSLNKTKLPDDAIVIIDCPPSLGVLTVNCLAAARHLVVTVHPGGLEMKALFFLQQTVDEIQDRINPDLDILGVVLTNCDMRKKVTEEAAQELRRNYHVLGRVRQDARIAYATGGGGMLSLFESPALLEYESVAKVIQNEVWAPQKPA